MKRICLSRGEGGRGGKEKEKKNEVVHWRKINEKSKISVNRSIALY